MMGRSLVFQVAMIVACAGRESTALADQIQHPAGFTFDLPKLGTAWAQEKRGDVVVVSDDTDKVPELQLFVFPVKQEGELPEIVSHLPAEVVRPGVELIESAVKSAKLVGKTANQTIADATVVTGELMLNGHDRAAFAVVKRNGHSLVLLAVPKAGIYERGVANFRAVLQGLKPTKTATAKGPSAKHDASSASKLPNLADIIAIREITATSTFADKHDMYAAWRTVVFDAVLDKATQQYMPTTAWCEGKPDEGVGEGLTISFAAPTQLDEIHIAAGVWRTAQLFASNNRITSLDVVVDGKPTTVKPATTRTWLSVPIGHAVSTITIKIGAVAKGKMNDSCISGISLVRKGADFTTVVGIDAKALGELPRTLLAIETTLSSGDRGPLEKLLDFPFTLRKVKHASWKTVLDACAAWDKAEAAGTSDDRTRPTCPTPIGHRDDDDRLASVVSSAPAVVEITFPNRRETQDVWNLRWHDGAWHLTAIDER